MEFNYHTHTSRCGHATGEDEEYVLTAIQNGIKHMGFSDHMPFRFPDGVESSYRVPMARAADYVASVRGLAAKYSDKIDLKLGFEMEYYPLHFDSMLSLARELGADYLLLGQHFLYNQRPDEIASSRKTDNALILHDYVDTVIEAARTGVFTYIAHPDIIGFIGDGEIYRTEMLRLAEASLNIGIPLEINGLGIREKRRYPNDTFWQIVSEVGSPVTFGFDAHSAETAYNKESLDVAMKMVKNLSLNYIGEPKLVSIK